MADEQEEFMTAGEAGQALGLSKARMAEYIRYGIIEAIPNPADSRKKMIRRTDVERLKRTPRSQWARRNSHSAA